MNIDAEKKRLMDSIDALSKAPPVTGSVGTMTPMEREVRFHNTISTPQKKTVKLDPSVKNEQPALSVSGAQAAPPASNTQLPPSTSTSKSAVPQEIFAPAPAPSATGTPSAPAVSPRTSASQSNPLGPEAIAGVELRSERISAAFLLWTNNQIQVQKAGRVLLEKKTDPSEIAADLKKLWKTARIPTHSVWANLHSRLMIQKYFCLPLTEDHLSTTLQLEAEELLQIDQNDIAMDYHLNDERGPNGELCGMMYAIPRWELLGCVNALQKAGLLVCGISTGACDMALLYQYLHPPSDTDQPLAKGVINLSEDSADIVLLFGKHSLYSRTVYSRAGRWKENLAYLAECLNDAVLYFGQWVSHDPVYSFHLCGYIPKNEDVCGFLLQETGIPVYLFDDLMTSSSTIHWSKALQKDSTDPIELTGSVAVALRRE